MTRRKVKISRVIHNDVANLTVSLITLFRLFANKMKTLSDRNTVVIISQISPGLHRLLSVFLSDVKLLRHYIYLNITASFGQMGFVSFYAGLSSHSVLNTA